MEVTVSGGQVTCELCGEKYDIVDVVDHLRRFHPESIGPDVERDLLTPDEDEPGREVARISIIRRLTDDDLVDYVEAVDTEGGDLPLTEALGMMRLAEDSLIRERMGE